MTDATDHPPANSALPELILNDLEPYLVHSRIEILANLRMLIDEHVLVTVYFNQGASFIVTRLLGINPEFEELIFDLAPDSRTNDKLQASNDLTVVSFCNHIKVQFTVNRAELTMFLGAPAFRVRAPRSILRLQRRAAFRARTREPVPDLLLSPTPDNMAETNPARVGIADVSVTGFAFVAPMDRPILTAGMQLQGCRLELNTKEAFDVDIEIRHASVFRDESGRDMCRVGCRLLKISGAAVMTIQRYVNRIDVAEGNSFHGARTDGAGAA